MERENKVRRLNEDEGPSENKNDQKVDDGENGTNENELSDMDKLPSEILMKILCCLSEQELVKCRILNTRWNEICCLLLQNKINNNPNSKLVLELVKSHGKDTLDCKTIIKRSLSDFLACFFPSEAENPSLHRPRPLPFSSFKISGLNYMYMDQLTKFVLAFRHIKTLFLEIKAQDVDGVGHFWRLLLKFAPNIEHLRMSSINSFHRIILFEPYFNFNMRSKPEDETQKQNETFLKNLKVLEIRSGNLYELDYFLQTLLSNTPKIQELIFLPSHGFPFQPRSKPDLPWSVYEAMEKAGLRNKANFNWKGQKCVITFK